MALDITKKLELGNTVYFECYFRDQQHTLSDPTPSSPTYTILNIRGDVVVSGTPTKKSTGVYYFFWTPSVEGDFVLIFTGTVSGYTTTMRRKFKVVRTSFKGEFSSSSSSSCSSSSCSSSFSSCSSSFSSCSSCSCSSSFSSSCSSSCSSSFSSSSSSSSA